MGFERQITRRAVLRGGGRMLIIATGSSLYTLPRAVNAAPYATSVTWEQHDIPLGTTPYVSPVLQSDILFNALESRWDATETPGAPIELAVRTSSDGRSWGDWHILHADTHARDLRDTATFGDLIIGAPARYAQFSATQHGFGGGSPSSLRAFRLTAVNTLAASGDAIYHAEAVNGITIVPRAGWSADEKLRFDKANKEIWPPEYRAIKKVIIHHTVTRDPETDPRATLRAIYQYHAVSRGWGDIGYNYLIDQQGTIYEGRFGGDRVVAGHALQYNWGSIGVAVLGTYTDHTISDAARSSVIALIRAKAADLDPVGKSFFIDRDNVMNISGHRGVINTSCPGDGFYPKMNNLRREMKGLPPWTGNPAADPIAANPPDVVKATITPSGQIDATLSAVAWGPTNLFTRDLLTAQVTIKNTGSAPLIARDPPPNFVYTEGDTYLKRGFPGVKGGVRIAMGPELLASSDPPYRWGIGRTLQPGESATISVAVRATTVQRSRFVISIVQDGGGPLDSDDAIQINIQPNPADPASVSPAPGIRFFGETKHNVSPDFLAYWSANGGLVQFGYPITEAFSDTNPDDKKIYNVQYFERARFETHPDKAGTPYAVQLGRLGVTVTQGRSGEKSFVPVPPMSDTADKRFFPEVGHTLSGVFKTYWDTHGSLPLYGFPLCEPFEEKSATDGMTYVVQYFERNRFEYHPDTKSVVLGLLGSEVLRRRGWIG
ncbi:MAG: N-acetylmuramoyl-L-alanine amidase [Thermomicrobiales bacterium]